jgi:hypothetical protein
MVVIQKIITCRLNVIDNNEQYCPDFIQMRMKKLQKQYIGYCSNGMLVTNILDIVKTSFIRTNAKSNEGGMHVDIEMEAEGIIYESGDIISDAVILKIEDSAAIASSKNASIVISINQTNILKVGDTTPVIVRMCKYNKFTDKISVSAFVFAPKISEWYYITMSGEYNKDNDIEVLFNKINKCKEQLASLNKDGKESAAFFNDLIYPYNKPLKWGNRINIQGIDEKIEIPITEATIDNMDNDFKSSDISLISVDTNYLHNKIYKTNKTFEITHNNWTLEGRPITIIKTDKASGYKTILTSYYKRINIIYELATTYPNKDSINKHKHIWDFYKMSRV